MTIHLRTLPLKKENFGEAEKIKVNGKKALPLTLRNINFFRPG